MRARPVPWIATGIVVVGAVLTVVGTRGAGPSYLLGACAVVGFAALVVLPFQWIAPDADLPRGYAALILAEATAVAAFVLVQPVGDWAGQRVGLVGLWGPPEVSKDAAGTFTTLAVLLLAVAGVALLASLLWLVRLSRRPGWKVPERPSIGFFAEGRRRDR